MAGRTILTQGLGGKKRPVTTFGKIDPDLGTWKYGGCGKNQCGMPATNPKERKEAKIWKTEDAKFYRKTIQDAKQYGLKRPKGADLHVGIKSGEWMKGYGE